MLTCLFRDWRSKYFFIYKYLMKDSLWFKMWFQYPRAPWSLRYCRCLYCSGPPLEKNLELASWILNSFLVFILPLQREMEHEFAVSLKFEVSLLDFLKRRMGRHNKRGVENSQRKKYPQISIKWNISYRHKAIMKFNRSLYYLGGGSDDRTGYQEA